MGDQHPSPVTPVKLRCCGAMMKSWNQLSVRSRKLGRVALSADLSQQPEIRRDRKYCD